MKKELMNLWDTCKTKQLAKIFKEYMESNNISKFDRRKKDNSNTYLISGSCTNWNRVDCYFYKDSADYGKENLEISLRKKSGNYMIISRNGIRAFECDYTGIITYNTKLLENILKDHKPLFDKLFNKIQPTCIFNNEKFKQSI